MFKDLISIFYSGFVPGVWRSVVAFRMAFDGRRWGSVAVIWSFVALYGRFVKQAAAVEEIKSDFLPFLAWFCGVVGLLVVERSQPCLFWRFWAYFAILSVCFGVVFLACVCVRA